MAREKWHDARLDWVPGSAEARTTTIREAIGPDFYSLQNKLKVGPKVLGRWMRYFGWTVRVAVRNSRNHVGIVVSEHQDERNLILRWWKSPRFEDPLWMRRLFALAALEQPELPTEITVDKNDQETIATLRHLEWKLGGVTDKTNTFVAEPWKPYPYVVPGVES